MTALQPAKPPELRAKPHLPAAKTLHSAPSAAGREACRFFVTLPFVADCLIVAQFLPSFILPSKDALTIGKVCGILMDKLVRLCINL
ncbi:MAG: hypothetical protein HKN63_06575 [Rhodobacteraceae bacterium]|nr:hypothetical protein [Paracoccaceae bacterium]